MHGGICVECYKDSTYCGFYLICKRGHGCSRALTPDVKKAANEAGELICQYKTFPDCFIRFFDNSFDFKKG